MNVYLLFENQYSAWLAEYLEQIEIFATREAAEAALNEHVLQEARDSLAFLEGYDPTKSWAVTEAKLRLERIRAGTQEPAWYDVGPVREESGVSVWKTAKYTIKEEEERVAEIERNVIAKHASEIAEVRAQAEGKAPRANEWAILEREVR